MDDFEAKRRLKVTYVDPTFPSGQEIFVWPGEREKFRECKLAYKCEEITFSANHRIETLLKSQDHTLFGIENKPLMKDVRQGWLGDCWLCASMMAVAGKEPESIRRMI